MSSSNRAIPGQRVMSRLFARVASRPALGTTPGFFARFGLEDPWAGAWGTGEADAEDPLFVYVSGAHYYAHVKQLIGARQRMLARFEAAQAALDGRFSEKRFIRRASTSFRAPSVMSSVVSGLSFLDPMPAAAPASEENERASQWVARQVKEKARPSSKAAAAPMGRPLARALLQAAPAESEIVRAVRAAGVTARSASVVERALAPVRDLSPAEQVRVVRRATRELKGVQRRWMEASVDEMAGSDGSPASIARHRDPLVRRAGRSTGLRTVMASSPSFVTLQHEKVQPAPAAEPVIRRVAQQPAPAARTSAHREVPQAAVAREVRTQRVTGRAGPAFSLDNIAEVVSESRQAPTARVARRIQRQDSFASQVDDRRGTEVLRSTPVSGERVRRLARSAVTAAPVFGAPVQLSASPVAYARVARAETAAPEVTGQAPVRARKTLPPVTFDEVVEPMVRRRVIRAAQSSQTIEEAPQAWPTSRLVERASHSFEGRRSRLVSESPTSYVRPMVANAEVAPPVPGRPVAASSVRPARAAAVARAVVERAVAPHAVAPARSFGLPGDAPSSGEPSHREGSRPVSAQIASDRPVVASRGIPQRVAAATEAAFTPVSAVRRMLARQAWTSESPASQRVSSVPTSYVSESPVHTALSTQRPHRSVAAVANERSTEAAAPLLRAALRTMEPVATDSRGTRQISGSLTSYVYASREQLAAPEAHAAPASVRTVPRDTKVQARRSVAPAVSQATSAEIPTTRVAPRREAALVAPKAVGGTLRAVVRAELPTVDAAARRGVLAPLPTAPFASERVGVPVGRSLSTIVDRSADPIQVRERPLKRVFERDSVAVREDRQGRVLSAPAPVAYARPWVSEGSAADSVSPARTAAKAAETSPKATVRSRGLGADPTVHLRSEALPVAARSVRLAEASRPTPGGKPATVSSAEKPALAEVARSEAPRASMTARLAARMESDVDTGTTAVAERSARRIGLAAPVARGTEVARSFVLAPPARAEEIAQTPKVSSRVGTAPRIATKAALRAKDAQILSAELPRTGEKKARTSKDASVPTVRRSASATIPTSPETAALEGLLSRLDEAVSSRWGAMARSSLRAAVLSESEPSAPADMVGAVARRAQGNAGRRVFSSALPYVNLTPSLGSPMAEIQQAVAVQKAAKVETRARIQRAEAGPVSRLDLAAVLARVSTAVRALERPERSQLVAEAPRRALALVRGLETGSPAGEPRASAARAERSGGRRSRFAEVDGRFFATPRPEVEPTPVSSVRSPFAAVKAARRAPAPQSEAPSGSAREERRSMPSVRVIRIARDAAGRFVTTSEGRTFGAEPVAPMREHRVPQGARASLARFEPSLGHSVAWAESRLQVETGEPTPAQRPVRRALSGALGLSTVLASDAAIRRADVGEAAGAAPRSLSEARVRTERTAQGRFRAAGSRWSPVAAGYGLGDAGLDVRRRSMVDATVGRVLPNSVPWVADTTAAAAPGAAARPAAARPAAVSARNTALPARSAAVAPVSGRPAARAGQRRDLRGTESVPEVRPARPLLGTLQALRDAPVQPEPARRAVTFREPRNFSFIPAVGTAPAAAAQEPGWASRVTSGSAAGHRVEPALLRKPLAPRLSTSGSLLTALARADRPEEVVQVILDRSATFKAVSGELSQPAAELIQKIGRMGAAARGEPESRVSAAVRSVSTAEVLSPRRTASEEAAKVGESVHRRVGGGRAPQGGSSQVMRLAGKLMNLIHLAENERRVSEARQQARLAADTESARSEGSAPPAAAPSSGGGEADISALKRDVLEAVLRELELTQQRRQEDPDGRNIWW